MSGNVTRRPLPALISLVALLALTALVWWRVTNRDDGSAKASPSSCSTPSVAVSAPAPRTLPPPRSVDVRVLNATARSGIASKARTTLVADGFRSTLKADNDDLTKNKVTGAGQIRFGAADRSAAVLLQYYFPGTQLVQLPTPSAQVVVSLGPAYTAVTPQKTVLARLAAAKITLTTTAAPAPAPAASPTTRC